MRGDPHQTTSTYREDAAVHLEPLPIHPIISALMLAFFFLPLLLVRACDPFDFADNASAPNAHGVSEPALQQIFMQASPRRIKIENVRVFNGDGLQPASTVVIAGGVIGVNSEGLPFDEVIDGQDGVLLPGFTDAHNHAVTVAELAALTSFGVTTCLSMACAPAARCNSLRHLPGLADFHAAVQAATSPGSPHAKMFPYLDEELIRNPRDANHFVAAQVGNGSEWIKLVAEQGGMTLADHEALVRETHRYNLKAATHVGDLDSMHVAIDSGSDLLQHIPRDVVLSQELAEKMLAGGQSNTPTLTAARFFARLGRGSLETAIQNTAILIQKQVPILTGTDAAVLLDIPFGASLHDEFNLLSEAGLSNLEILRATTIVPAEIYGLTDRGVIAPGKRADLVLLADDPLLNISNTRTLQRVWVGGIEYKAVARF